MKYYKDCLKEGIETIWNPKGIKKTKKPQNANTPTRKMDSRHNFMSQHHVYSREILKVNKYMMCLTAKRNTFFHCT